MNNLLKIFLIVLLVVFGAGFFTELSLIHTSLEDIRDAFPSYRYFIPIGEENAVQESSTKEMDVQEQAEDGKGMGERNAKYKILAAEG